MALKHSEDANRLFREPIPNAETHTMRTDADALSPMERDAEQIILRAQHELHGLLAKYQHEIVEREHGILEAIHVWTNTMSMGAKSAGSYLKVFSVDDKDSAAHRFVTGLTDYLIDCFVEGWDDYLPDDDQPNGGRIDE